MAKNPHSPNYDPADDPKVVTASEGLKKGKIPNELPPETEAILLRDGFVTEGAASNVFVVRDGREGTPPLSHCILGGITRDLIIELCREKGLPVIEAEIPETTLRDADEIWISSSTKDVVPVTELNGRPVGDGRPGDTWKTLARHYIEFKRRLCGL